MAGNKYSSELLLQGKFEFDQNSLSVAAQFTQELVKVIEGPLQEMSQRIVNNLFGRQGIGGGMPSGMLQHQSGLAVPSHMVPGAGASGPTPPPPPIQQLGVHGIVGGPMAQLPPQLQSYMERFASPHDVGLQERLLSQSPYTGQRNIAMMMQKAQRSGLDVYSNLSEEQKKSFAKEAESVQGDIATLIKQGTDLQKQYTTSIQKAQSEVGTLRSYSEALQKDPNMAQEMYKGMSENLKKVIDEYNTADPKTRRDPVVAVLERIERLQQESVESERQTSAGIQKLKGEREALLAPTEADEETRGARRARRIQTMANVAGLVGSAVAFGAQVPYMMEEREASAAELERGSARALQSGNINRYMAMQELGGDTALTERSRRSALLSGVGQILGGVGIGAAGIMSGIGAVPAVIAGGGMAISGAHTLMNMESQAVSFREREIESRLGQTREFRDASSRARAQAIQSFETARGMGDQSLEDLLYGGVSIGSARSQLRAGIAGAGTREQEAEAIRRFRDASAGGTRALSGQSLREYAAERGIDYGQLAPVIGEMGGRARTAGGYSPMQESINLATLGIGAGTQAELLYGQGRGADGARMDPRQAFAQIKDMYAETFATGIEKSQLPRAMERFGQMAASIGYGGTAVAQEQMRRATTMAGGMFGEGYGGAQLDFANRMQRFQFGGGPLGSGGLGNAMAMSAMGNILQGTQVGGKSLQDTLGGNAGVVSMMLAQQGQTDESMKTILMKAGGMSEQDAAAAVKQLGGAKGLESMRTKGMVGAYGGIGEGPLGFLTAMMTGAEGGAQMEAALKSPSAMQKLTQPKTAEEMAKEADARKLADAGIIPDSLGGKARAQELGVESAELSAAFSTLKAELPTFANSIRIVNEAIENAVKTMQEKKASNSFGN
jgi:hypothetical protein